MLDDTVVNKVVIESDPKPTGFRKIAWEGINVEAAVDLDLDTQIPAGWSGVSDPSMVVEYPDQPPYPGEDYESVNEYTVAVDPTPDAPPEIIVGTFESGAGGGTAGSTPMLE